MSQENVKAAKASLQIWTLTSNNSFLLKLPGKIPLILLVFHMEQTKLIKESENFFLFIL